MATPETKLPLKLIVDSKRNKVIFAEAGSDFVDVLLSFLTLPLGTITRRLNQHFGGKTSALGCFNNLYSSVQNLSNSDFVENEDRHIILHPKSSSQTKLLKLNVDDSKVTEYYYCHRCCSKRTCTIKFSNRCPSCGTSMCIELFPSDNSGGVFVDSSKSFIITDDLQLMPSLYELNFQQIQHLACDAEEFVEKTIKVGLNEMMHLLKWSLISLTPLTNLLVWHFKSQVIEDLPNTRVFVPIAFKTGKTTRVTVIKAVMQKSTNKLLYFLAGLDFVNFLVRLLTIPIGTAMSLLGPNACLGCIGMLYSCVPKLSSEYFVSEKQFLTNPTVAVFDRNTDLAELIELDKTPGVFSLQLIDLVNEKWLIKGLSTFMVSDDLTVTPLSSMSIMLQLQSSKIPISDVNGVPISDVNEIPIKIGPKEALDILKASLTSTTSVLSDALQLMKQPKQEK